MESRAVKRMACIKRALGRVEFTNGRQPGVRMKSKNAGVIAAGISMRRMTSEVDAVSRQNRSSAVFCHCKKVTNHPEVRFPRSAARREKPGCLF
jgi:hypothetical protein